MRSNVVFAILLVLLGVLGATLSLRSRAPHAAPEPAPSASAAASSAAPSASAPAPVSSSLPVTPSKPKPKLGRPLRVVGLGWDVIVPGVLANGGLAPSKKGEFGKAGLEVSFQAVDAAGKVEKALARGGSDDDGADVAILPLPALVAGWERLRALNLAAFYVVAWSRGRETLASSKDSLSALPAQGEISVDAKSSEAATFLALTALELAGVEPSRVTIGGKGPALVTAHSKERDKSGERHKQADILLSTADASRLVPWVAVAQRSLVTGQPDALIAWAKAWHAGQKLLDKDAATAARTIGALDGAPEPLVLLERLGELAPVSLSDNAELTGLSGRGAVTLSSLFERAWRLWREARLLSTPSPERAPTIDLVVAGVARAAPKLLEPSAPTSAGEEPKPSSTKPRVLVTRRVPGTKLDGDDREALVTELGITAGIFHRSTLRVSVHGVPKKKGDEIVQLAVDRYGLDGARIERGKAAARPATTATIEVLAAE